MKRRAFGEPVTAREVQERFSRDHEAFVRLCRDIIALEAERVLGAIPDLRCSELTHHRDGGIDAYLNLEMDASIPPAGAWVGRDANVWQFKVRDASRRPISKLAPQIVRKAREDLRRALEESGTIDHFTLVTNLQLGPEPLARAQRALGSEAGGRLHCVVLDADAIATAVGIHPHLRYHFAVDPTFVSTDVIEGELRRLLEPLSWPGFEDRPGEREGLRSFLAQGGGGALYLTGPRAAGRTRLALEAVRDLGPLAVWATDPGGLREADFRDLDAGGRERLCLVVDNLRPGSRQESQVLGWAGKVANLRVLLLGQSTALPPGIRIVEIPHLDPLAMTRLLEAAAPDLDIITRSRIRESSEGLPGLAVILAREALRGGSATRLESVTIRPPGLRLGQFLADSPDLSREDRDALQALSLLSRLEVRENEPDDVRDLAECLDRDEATLRRRIARLRRSRWISSRGRWIAVVPHLLATALAEEALRSIGRLADRLLARPGLSLRFLERLRDIPESRVASEIAAAALSEGGRFLTLRDICDRAEVFRMFAQIRPESGIEALERCLSAESIETIREGLAGEARREVVWLLRSLLQHASASQAALRLLFVLAEAENETWADNATGLLKSAFDARHLQVAATLPQRLSVLNEAASSARASKRRLAAECASSVFGPMRAVVLHPTQGTEPDGAGRPRTWEELREYQEGVLDVWGRLLRDDDPGVMGPALQALLEDFRWILQDLLGPGGEGGIRKLFSIWRAVREGGGIHEEDPDWVRMLTRLRSALQEMSDGSRPGLPPARQEVEAALRDLWPGDERASFSRRLRHWLGAVGRHAGMAGSVPEGRQAPRRLAEEVARGESELSGEDLDWLAAGEATAFRVFLEALGELDRDRKWLEPLVSRAPNPAGPDALASYVRGWARASPGEAEAWLEEALEGRTLSLQQAAAAILCLAPSARAVRWLDEILRREPSPRTWVAARLRRDRWLLGLEAEPVLSVLQALDDGSSGMAMRLVHLLHPWLRDGREAPSQELLRMGWELLRRAHPATADEMSDLEGLALALGGREPEELVGFVVDHLLVPAGNRALSAKWGYEDLLHAALDHDRRGVLAEVLSRSLPGGPLEGIGPLLLGDLIEPSKDRDALLGWARAHGEASWPLVARSLNAGRAGFWELAAAMLEESPPGEILDATSVALLDVVHTTGVVCGSILPLIGERLRAAPSLLEHPNPRVNRWARRAVEALSDWKRREEGLDPLESIAWDRSIGPEEIAALLAGPDSPERMWAVVRIMERLRAEDALRLLSRSDIRKALESGRLRSEVERFWQDYLVRTGRGHG